MNFYSATRYFVLTMFLLGFAGCASTAEIDTAVQIENEGAMSEPLTGPDGTEHQFVRCYEIKLCYEKASGVCNGKYRIVDNTTSFNRELIKSVTHLLVKCEASSPRG